MKSFFAHNSLLILAVLVMAGCTSSPYFQKQVAIPNASWQSSFMPEIEIEIEDTALAYQTFLILRHDNGFKYSNFWFRLHIQHPGDSIYRQNSRIEKTLADAEGKWLAQGFGGIWEHKMPLSKTQSVDFQKTGKYKIKIEQLMRTDPLPSILNVGLRIEKKGAKNTE